MDDIGRCTTCIHYQNDCPRPKHAADNPHNGCRDDWTNGVEIEEIDEHWPCPECDEILFIESADQHRCPAAGAGLGYEGE